MDDETAGPVPAHPRTARLTEGTPAGALAEATLPLALSLLLLFAVQLAETWLVGLLGPDALAALGFALPVSLTVLSFGIGLGAGTSAVVARALGAGDADAPALAADALWLGIAVAVVLVALGWLAAPHVLAAMGAVGAPAALALDWLRLWLVGAVPLLASMVVLSVLRAAGDMRFQGAAMGGAAVLGFALDFPLAFGVGPVPGLGLTGIALASALAWTAVLAVSLRRLAGQGLFRPDRPTRAGFAASARRVLRIGLPAAATNAIIPAASGLFTALLAAYGPAAVAGFALGSRAEALALTVFFALSAVANPFAAQNLGAGRPDRVQEGLRAALLFCAAGGGGVALLLWLLGPWLARHLTPDPAVATTAAHYFLVMPLGFGAVGALAVANAAFNGLDRPLAAVATSLLRTFLLGVPLAWLGGRLWGEVGVLAGICAANLAAGGLAAWWVLRAARGNVRTTTVTGSQIMKR